MPVDFQEDERFEVVGVDGKVTTILQGREPIEKFLLDIPSRPPKFGCQKFYKTADGRSVRRIDGETFVIENDAPPYEESVRRVQASITPSGRP